MAGSGAERPTEAAIDSTVGLGQPAEVPDPDPESFRRIAALVYRHTGIQLGDGKSYFVVGRLGPLYRSRGCRSWNDLCSWIEGAGAGVLEQLVQAVVTRETFFFRDTVPFQALLQRVLPEAIEGQRRPVPLRVWSAGCSTGQEPYSIALTLWDAVERGDIQLEVWATDICTTTLRRAQAGVFGPLELSRGLDPHLRKRFFEELPGGEARVREEVRRLIRFDRLNLCADRPRESGFHTVFCRNVAIYFDRQVKAQVYQNLGSTVRSGGYLVLGAAETLFPSLPGFETVYHAKCLLFRKTGR